MFWLHSWTVFASFQWSARCDFDFFVLYSNTLSQSVIFRTQLITIDKIHSALRANMKFVIILNQHKLLVFTKRTHNDVYVSLQGSARCDFFLWNNNRSCSWIILSPKNCRSFKPSNNSTVRDILFKYTVRNCFFFCARIIIFLFLFWVECAGLNDWRKCDLFFKTIGGLARE